MIEKAARILIVSVVVLGACSDGGGSSSGAGDLSFEADFIGKNGPHSISGTVTFPAGASAGRQVQIEVIRRGDIMVSGNQLGRAGTTSGNATQSFSVTALEPGTYKIGIRVDETNDGKVNDPGDFIGFARGAGGAPKLDSDSADEIVVGSGPVTGVDIVLAKVP